MSAWAALSARPRSLYRDSDTTTRPINLGNPVETSIAELADRVIELTGSRSKIVRHPLPVMTLCSAVPTSLKPGESSAGVPRHPSQTASRARSHISTGFSAKTKNLGARGNKR